MRANGSDCSKRMERFVVSSIYNMWDRIIEKAQSYNLSIGHVAESAGVSPCAVYASIRQVREDPSLYKDNLIVQIEALTSVLGISLDEVLLGFSSDEFKQCKESVEMSKSLGKMNDESIEALRNKMIAYLEY